MSLKIEGLKLHDFRSYGDFSLESIGPITVFHGPNAVGKTNLIEAIQLVTSLESFRNPSTDQLIRWGCEGAWVQADIVGDSRELQMRMMLDSRGRRYRLNGKQRTRQELRAQLPAVLFSPDDLRLVKGGSDIRRAALDAVGIQVSKNYLSVKRDYEKVLRQKNRLLKEDITPGYLASVNEVLAKVGSHLLVYRLRILKALRAELPARHRAISGGTAELSVEYRPTIYPDGDELLTDRGFIRDSGIDSYLEDRNAVEERFHQMLERRSLDELTRRMSLVGPHRDQVIFNLDGRPATDFASQGQQRTIAIAEKLSELNLIEQMTGQKPLLLLDDVMSELDASRRELLTRYVRDATQTFITTTNLEYFTPKLLESAHVVALSS